MFYHTVLAQSNLYCFSICFIYYFLFYSFVLNPAYLCCHTWINVRVRVCNLGTPYLKPISQLRFDYDTMTPRRIRLRRKWSKLRFAFDSTGMRLRHDYDENWHVHFLLASNGVEWKQARAIRRSRIVVVSQSNRNCNHGLSFPLETCFVWIVYSTISRSELGLHSPGAFYLQMV